MVRTWWLVGGALSLLLAGCRGDDIVECVPAARPLLADFTRRNSAPVQTFTLSLAQSQTIRTSGGATLDLPANGFRLPNGTLATGTAELRVRELYVVPDMLLADIPTTTAPAGQLLVSGGEFFLQVWQNGTRLQFDPATAASVTLRSPRPAGVDSSRQTLWARRRFGAAPDSTGWVPAATPAPVVSLTGNFYRVSLPPDSSSWWNIGRLWFAPTAPTGSLEVTVPTAAGETRVYLRPVGANGLLRLPVIAGSSNTRWRATVPLGTDLKVAVLQAANGQLFWGSQRLAFPQSLVVSPPLTAVTEAEALTLIQQF